MCVPGGPTGGGGVCGSRWVGGLVGTQERGVSRAGTACDGSSLRIAALFVCTAVSRRNGGRPRPVALVFARSD